MAFSAIHVHAVHVYILTEIWTKNVWVDHKHGTVYTISYGCVRVISSCTGIIDHPKTYICHNDFILIRLTYFVSVYDYTENYIRII